MTHLHKSRRLLPPPARAATTTTEVTAASSLPDDLVFEVLSRLPVRSVCRFRCVSRGWNALVYDPAFLAAHRSLHTEPLLVAASERDDHGESELRMMDMDGCVVGTTKVAGGTGLVSASTDDLVCVIDHSSGGARVIDPTTGEVLADCDKLEAIYLGEPGPAITFGFGRAVPSGAHKVVRLRNGLSCQVFTVEDGTGWRWPQSLTPYIPFRLGPSVFLNGVIYFPAFPLYDKGKLFCFDRETEKWKKIIKGPSKGLKPCKKTESVRISELNGTLCVARMETSKNDYRRAIIWLLTSLEKDTWNKAYIVSMEPSIYDFRPLRVTPDSGKLIFYCSTRDEADVLGLHDPRTMECTTLHRLDYNVTEIGLCNLHLDRFLPVKNPVPAFV